MTQHLLLFIKYIIQSIVHHYDYHHIMTIHKLTANGTQNRINYYVIGFDLPCNLPRHLMATKKIQYFWLNFSCNLINNTKLIAVE